MSFVVREARESDINDIVDIAQQFSLLNLPPDKKIIEKKVETSMASFSGELEKDKAVYMFVTEDADNKILAGSSQIVAKHGTPDNPNYSFKLLKKERFSKDLGIGFIHQVLRLKIDSDGSSEVGGLVVNKSYRRRPEKVGRLTSLHRFLYIGMKIDRFEDEIMAEMAPPLTDEGRSEFWEALGRRFTGMPYREADALSRRNKDFIHDLFPEEDIYLCLLDSQARLVMGRVGQETMPALHMLESLGFKFKEEVDPFDGGPHISVPTKDISIVKMAKHRKLSKKNSTREGFSPKGMFSIISSQGFRSCASAFDLDGEDVILPEKTKQLLGAQSDDIIYCVEDS